MDKSEKVCCLYVATLRSMALIHQHNHWTITGNGFYSFYGNHLLLDKLYNSTLEDIDLAAEKFIGLFGSIVLNYNMQADFINKILLKYSKLEKLPIEMSAVVEKDFLKFSNNFYDLLKEENKLSLGTDDMIMSISSRHEENLYLLKQTLLQKK